MRLLILALAMNFAWANTFIKTISFGKVKVGEQRIPLSTKDFEIKVDLPGKTARAKLIKNSIQWVRTEDVLLTPRARIAIAIKDEPEDLHIRYQSHSLILQQIKKISYIEFYVSLFQPDEIEIFQKDKKIGSVRVFAKEKEKKTKKTHLIDYSCAKYKARITGLDGEYISIGCRETTIGDFGEERPMVEILWTSANYRLLDKSEPPYIAVFFKNRPIKMTVVHERTGEQKVISIDANIPKRTYRLKTALGLGPYAITSQESASEKLENESGFAAMLYGKFDLDKETSFRFFDAYIKKTSTFNNLGFYYAYDLANILDNRVQITALLGAQHIYYKYNEGFEAYSEMIYPQGAELIFKHVFGWENYSLVFGGFIDTNNSDFYQNVWVRFGRRVFWELNYIAFENPENPLQNAQTYGLSIGFPFMSFF
jgi:hypothetical protein